MRIDPDPFPTVTHHPHLQQPILLGNITIPNRIMFTTHGPRLSQARYERYIAERAQGGVGLMGFNLGPLGIMQFPFGPGRGDPAFAADIDAVPPHPLTAEGRAWYDGQIPAYRGWAEAAHRHGAKVVGQLYHSGAAQHTDIFQPTVAPSSVRDEYERHIPHPLSPTEIAGLIEAHALCARRAVEAGYDGVELHAAHGYLGYQFLSPLFNRRTDRYGGSIDNRGRFLVETVCAVRDAVGAGFLIGVRLNGPDRVEGGLTLEDVVAVSVRMAAEGAGYISISGGSYAGLRGGANLPYVAPAYVAPGPNVPAAAAVRRAVTVPVIASGRIANFDLAERIVGEGEADIVGMVRALIADPRAIAKSFAGRRDEIVPCIACNECHTGRTIACSTNPAAGREDAMELAPTQTPKRILIVGAGPAGLECAMAAAQRGHAVTLVDRRAEAGGMLTILARSSRQAEFGRYLDYTSRRVRALDIDLRLAIEADPGLVGEIAPDIVVMATGAVTGAGIPSDRPESVVDAALAMADPSGLGPHVVVAGGLEDHLPPLIAADFLARAGRKVTLLMETIAPAPALESGSLVMLLDRLLRAGVALMPMTKAVEFRAGAVVTRNSLTGAPGRIANIDSVVVLGNLIPDNALAKTVRALGIPVHLIGDALSPRRMLHATLDGARLGRTL
jgi:2,4-dienoyl-CoA reductase-like NADH-dependent reductase (Old Yellow Enzyme family)